MFRKIIEHDYKEYLAMNRDKMPTGMYQSLKSHERIPKFFTNLEKELAECSWRGIHLDRIKIKEIVYNMTETFIRSFKQVAEEKALSMLERQRRVQEAEKNKIKDREEMQALTEELERDGVIVAGD